MTISAAILGVQGPVLSQAEAAFFGRTNPWGFVLFARNIDTPAQVQALCADLRAAVGRAAPIFIDQEGGRVQRLRAPYWTEFPAPLDQAPLGADSFRLRGLLLGAELHALGIDGNFAPCLDLAWPQTHPFLRSRCMGESVEAVIDHGRALCEGLLQAGVLPVIKHMPGHGRATQDSHKELPLIDQPQGALEVSDFAPFKALSDMPLGMTAHIRLPFLGDVPCTQNPDAIAMMRQDWGFDGVLMTDDIGMGALQGDIATRAQLSIAAGCDLVLHCNDDMAGFGAAAEGAGPLTGAALARCDAALSRRITPEALDIQALKRDYAALIGQIASAHV